MMVMVPVFRLYHLFAKTISAVLHRHVHACARPCEQDESSDYAAKRDHVAHLSASFCRIVKCLWPASFTSIADTIRSRTLLPGAPESSADEAQ